MDLTRASALRRGSGEARMNARIDDQLKTRLSRYLLEARPACVLTAPLIYLRPLAPSASAAE
jgi:hypothetical protein